MTPAFAALIFVILSAAASIAYIQLRHIGLTALVMAGALLSAALWLFPGPWVPPETALSALVLGMIAGQLVMVAIVRRVCGGAKPRDAAGFAILEVVKAAGPVLVAILVATASFAIDRRMRWNCADAALSVLAAWLGACASCALAGFIPYTENFVARANRIREARARLLRLPSGATEARWAFSVTGIALILATLAGFGMRPMHFYREEILQIWVYAPILAALVFAGFAFAARDWRLGLAGMLTLSLIAAFALWAMARDWRAVGAVTSLWISLSVAMAALPPAVLAAAARQAMRDGDDPPTALLRAFQEHAPAAIFAGLASAILWLPVALFGIVWPAVMALASIFSPLFFCAFAVTIYTLLPRYRGVEEVFGKR